MKKSFKILYVVNLALIIICFVFNLFSVFSESLGSYLLLTIFTILIIILTLIMLVICIIMGIINIKQNMIIKKKIIFMLFILVLLLFTSILAPQFIKNVYNSFIKKDLEDISTILVKEVKQESLNKYVYFYNDLANYYSNINNTDIKENSYITNYEDKVYICLSNGKHKLEGYEDDLKLKKINSFNKDCNYEFSSVYLEDGSYKADGETYLKAYLENKYNIRISDVKVNYECGLFECNIDDYDVTTADVIFKANADVKNNNIIVTDNYYETINNLNDKDKVIYSIKNYTLNYLNADSITIHTSIYDLYWLNDSQIIMSTTYSKDDAYKYLQSLGEYLKNNDIDCNIIINRKIIENNNVGIDYAMNLIVSDNNFVINE